MLRFSSYLMWNYTLPSKLTCGKITSTNMLLHPVSGIDAIVYVMDASVTLANGLKMPLLGLGTWLVSRLNDDVMAWNPFSSYCPLCEGNRLVKYGFSHKGSIIAEPWCFFYCSLNKRSNCRWLKTPWRSRDVTVIDCIGSCLCYKLKCVYITGNQELSWWQLVVWTMQRFELWNTQLVRAFRWLFVVCAESGLHSYGRHYTCTMIRAEKAGCSWGQLVSLVPIHHGGSLFYISGLLDFSAIIVLWPVL